MEILIDNFKTETISLATSFWKTIMPILFDGVGGIAAAISAFLLYEYVKLSRRQTVAAEKSLESQRFPENNNTRDQSHHDRVINMIQPHMKRLSRRQFHTVRYISETHHTISGLCYTVTVDNKSVVVEKIKSLLCEKLSVTAITMAVDELLADEFIYRTPVRRDQMTPDRLVENRHLEKIYVSMVLDNDVVVERVIYLVTQAGRSHIERHMKSYIEEFSLEDDFSSTL